MTRSDQHMDIASDRQLVLGLIQMGDLLSLDCLSEKQRLSRIIWRVRTLAFRSMAKGHKQKYTTSAPTRGVGERRCSVPQLNPSGLVVALMKNKARVHFFFSVRQTAVRHPPVDCLLRVIVERVERYTISLFISTFPRRGNVQRALEGGTVRRLLCESPSALGRICGFFQRKHYP